MLLWAYVAIGVFFALYFLFVGYKKLDGSAENAGLGVRLLWMPAAFALWPVLIAKLAGSRTEAGSSTA